MNNREKRDFTGKYFDISNNRFREDELINLIFMLMTFIW